MQRLFSTFPAGSPGAGLVCLRVGPGIPLLYLAARSLSAAASPGPVRIVLDLAASLAGILLLAGLWTPFAGGVVAVTQLSILFSQPFSSHAYPFAHILLPVLGVALALLGPGAWSVDARLFGRKVIVDVRQSKRGSATSHLRKTGTIN